MASAAQERLSVDEKLIKSRVRNRDHSRKSRQRKKAYVEGLQQEVEGLGLFKSLVEQCADPISVNTADNRVGTVYTCIAKCVPGHIGR